MLLVKTTIGPSSIHGIGLFAAEFIPKGTVIWTYNAVIDSTITEEQFMNLPETAKEQVKKYAYKSNNTYILCGDDARFFNHSEHPTADDVTAVPDTIAAKDIHSGEEITSDYRTFDEDWNIKITSLLPLPSCDQ